MWKIVAVIGSVCVSSALAGCCKSEAPSDEPSASSSKPADTAASPAVNTPVKVLDGYSGLRIPAGGKIETGKKVGELRITYPNNVFRDAAALLDGDGWTVTKTRDTNLVLKADIEKGGKRYKYHAMLIDPQTSLVITPVVD